MINYCCRKLKSVKSRKGVCNKQCCVAGCRMKKTESISLHRFPLFNEEYMKYWIEQLQIIRPVNKYTLVCSNHFVPEDFCTGKRLN